MLFLGVTKAVLKCMNRFMKSYGHGAAFEALINPLLEDLAGFHVDYCQTKTLPDSNWISDNCIALARIFPWVYGIYCINSKPSDDKKQEFQAEITIIQQLINSYYVMISALMYRAPEDEDRVSFERRVEIIDQKIKVFLSLCSRLSGKIDDQFWEKRGNFYSLL